MLINHSTTASFQTGKDSAHSILYTPTSRNSC